MTIATDQGDWVKQHLGTIEHSYGKAPHAGEVLPLLKDLYAQAGAATHLSHVNRGLLKGLGIPTRITWSTDYVALEGSDAFSPTDRLVTLCVRAGATTYLSGPAAQAYMGVEAFANRGVNVEWMSYEGVSRVPSTSWRHAGGPPLRTKHQAPRNRGSTAQKPAARSPARRRCADSRT